MGYGAFWFDEEPEHGHPSCMVCKESRWTCLYYGNGTHPYIETNLEYLAWKYETKQKALAAV